MLSNLSDPPILVIDPERDLEKKQKLKTGNLKNPRIFVHTEFQAQEQMGNSNQQFASILINPKVSSPNGMSIIKLAQLYHLGTPVFLIQDTESKTPYETSELKNLGIHKVLSKPIDLPSVFPVAPLNPAPAGVAEPDLLDESLNPQETPQTFLNEEYTPVRAVNFIYGGTCTLDLFLQINPKRYVLFTRAHQPLGVERVLQYLKRGIRHFYVKKQDQLKFLEYCDALVTKFLASPETPVEVKAQQVFQFGEEVYSFIREHGVGETQLQFSRQFVSHSTRLLRELKPHQNHIIRDFIKKMEAFEHGVATTIISSLLVQPAGITAPNLQEAVGLASLLHDLSLTSLFPDRKTVEEENLNPQELQIYYKHPLKTAELLYNVSKKIDPAALKAIAHHHERRTGRGFPKQLIGGQFTILAEIVGLSDEFVELMKKVKANPQLNLFAEMQNRHFNGFSYPVIEAFRKVLLRKM